jgi:O-antigen ligase
MKLLKNSLPYIAFAFALSLPFANGINNIVLTLFYLAIFVLVLAKKLHYQKTNKAFLLSSTIVLLIPVLWSFFMVDDVSMVKVALERRLSFALTPLAFLFFLPKDIQQIKNLSLKGLVYGSVASSVFLLAKVLVKYYSVKPLFSIDKDLFNYFHTSFHFTNPIGIHPSYIGMFVLISLAILLFVNDFCSRWWKLLFVGILSLSILFLNSRLIQGLYFLLLIIYLWQLFKLKFKRLRIVIVSITTVLLLGALLFFTLFKNTYLYQRLTKEMAWELSYEVGTKYNRNGSGDSRLARWDAAVELIKQKPILGYGVSMESKVLKQKYVEMEMFTAANEGYNAHNQFLGFSIEGGLIALILLCFYLGSNLVEAVKSKRSLELFFYLSIISICLVENYLLRNAGITFVSFFGTVFLFSGSSKLNNSSK